MTTKKRNNQLLSRRETLRLLGAAGATTLVGVGDKQALGLARAARWRRSGGCRGAERIAVGAIRGLAVEYNQINRNAGLRR